MYEDIRNCYSFTCVEPGLWVCCLLFVISHCWSLLLFLPLGFLLRGSSGRCDGSASVESSVGKLLLVCRLQDLEGAHQCLINGHHGTWDMRIITIDHHWWFLQTCIIKLSTVVGSREQCDQLPLGEELVTILNNLTTQTCYNDHDEDQSCTWWARHIKSKSCLWRNLATTSAPKVKETPLSFSPQPMVSLSGSDQSRSQSSPWSGTSVGLMIRLNISNISECTMVVSVSMFVKIFSLVLTWSAPCSGGQETVLRDNRRSSHQRWRPRGDSWSSLWRSSTTWCCIFSCTHRRIRRFCWLMHTRGCHATEKSFLDIWSGR